MFYDVWSYISYSEFPVYWLVVKDWKAGCSGEVHVDIEPAGVGKSPKTQVAAHHYTKLCSTLRLSPWTPRAVAVASREQVGIGHQAANINNIIVVFVIFLRCILRRLHPASPRGTLHPDPDVHSLRSASMHVRLPPRGHCHWTAQKLSTVSLSLWLTTGCIGLRRTASASSWRWTGICHLNSNFKLNKFCLRFSCHVLEIGISRTLGSRDKIKMSSRIKTDIKSSSWIKI